ncbi:MAG: S-layer homology domain-containing protein [Clostridia bacterium]|nr:S-layer homology domain-containing protein [Clostridia bacterium]
MKQRIISLFIILAMSVVPLPILAEEDSIDVPISFDDVLTEHIAYEAIMSLAEKGVINGKGDGKFYPEDTLKREEFVKILTEALALQKGDKTLIFYDVPAGTWYSDYVMIATASGLINGVSENMFGVGAEITRQDLAVILMRYLKQQGIQENQSATTVYADDSDISDYAKEAVAFVSSLNVMDSREGNMWYPQSPATRAETAMAVYNLGMAEHNYVMSLGKDAGIKFIDPPYDDVITDDRIAEMTPTPFDASNYDVTEIYYNDFEDDDHGMFSLLSTSGNATLMKEEGYNSNGCIKTIDGESGYCITWKTKPGEFVAGDYLVASAMFKCEEYANTGEGYKGYLSPIIQIYDDQKTWLTEDRLFKWTGDTDWTLLQNIIEIPEALNQLRTPEYYEIRINIQNGIGSTGTVWTDDLHLYKVKFPPMDTVLMEPVYKGIVKGEDGIGDIKVRAYINDANGAWDLSKINLTTQITDEDRKVYLSNMVENVTSVVDVCFSSKTLPMNGDFWLESILIDSETGEEIQRQEWALHKREADFATVMDIDEYGRMTRNGEPVLMTSIYAAKDFGNAIQDIFENPAWDNWNYVGQDWFLNYGKRQDSKEHLKALEDTGTTFSLYPGGMRWEKLSGVYQSRVKTQAELRAVLTRIANAWKDHPSLSSYKTSDELRATQWGPELEWVQKILSGVDLDHPTFGAIDNPIANRPGIYAKMNDILAYDPYPVTGKEDQAISLVYDRLSLAHKLNPGRPLGMILQGFHFASRGDLRGPTLEEYRNMTFQAICAGVVMIDTYTNFEILENPWMGKTSEQIWDEFSMVMNEVNYLEPIIISAQPAPYYEINTGGADWLKTTARRLDGKSYLFTVNTDQTQRDARIYLDGAKEIKGMYSKKVYEADDDGWFEIEFDEYETEVFEWESPDYLSSHADLIHFGISGIHMLDAESEAPVFCVPEGMTEAEYSFKVSDYASIYINDEKVEKTGTLKFDGVNELKIKIVSQDGRFTTEKTYQLQRD